MKKAEELKLYAPEPKRPELDAALCMSVAEGQGMGRYIEGKVLTVAVWDKKEKPLVVWRFFGDYWTGELRGNENPTKGELSPRQIKVKPCQCLTWRTEVPATKGEAELLQNYFDDRRPGCLIGIVEDALSAHTRKKREERNARQEAETQKLFENLPEPPEDLSKQVLKVCSDAGFLWVTNDKQSVIEPGGVEKKVSIQRVRCDSCGGEYTLSELLKHKSTATCECCGEKMQVRNEKGLMEQSNAAIKAALELYAADHGKLNDGDSFTTKLNNCVLTISLKDGNLDVQFDPDADAAVDTPYTLNMALDIYEEENNG